MRRLDRIFRDSPLLSPVSHARKLLANMTLRVRLLLSFVGIVLLVDSLSALLGVGLIHRTLPRLQDVLAVDLSAAREVYRQYVSGIADMGRLMAQRRIVRENLERGDVENLIAPMQAFRQSQDLDILMLADVRGEVVFPERDRGKNISASGLAMIAQQSLLGRKEISASLVFSQADLAAESPELVERARIDTISTPHAAVREHDNTSKGLVAAVAIPVVSDDGVLLGVLCAGQLLNRRNAVVDRIRSTLYRQETFEQRDVAIASIFLDDKRIATTTTTQSGDRAVGTLISEDVYNRVIRGGERWIRPGYIVDDWYLTAYEPIRDPRGQVIGAVGFGLLERKFQETERRAIEIPFALTGVAVALAIIISYLLSKSVMRPVNSLIRATEKIAAGSSPQPITLDHAPPEIEALGKAFNSMIAAIRARDRQLHRQTHEKLMRSDRLAMIGQLAAGVAHEINNPLGSILLFSRLVMQQTPPQGKIRENLDRIEKETKRCHTIVRGLLDFARERKPLVESLDINQVLDATLKLFEGQFLFQNIQVVREYNTQLPAIEADQSQLQQVFMNIILNAVDAMNGIGRLVLATRESESAGFIDIGISDSGSGIPPENLDRVFDPFFTTKGVGHGTGLGLSVSYGIVQNHGGDIVVSSTPGSGATFTVSLPAAKGSS
jgi:two-component system NtrC family sensor kinase